MRRRSTGKVYLVGAGPGRASLLTLRAREVLSCCDVVVYDHLVDTGLLELCKQGAKRVYVGKLPDHHPLSQGEINSLLIEEAKGGATVVRLKGGDPFVFGRGAEEAEALLKAKVPFEVVPGVSSATAVPAFAGIPVTHRRFASSFAVVTGHEDPTKERSRIQWAQLATGVDTLVFLMGVRNLNSIAKNLIAHGRPSDTPSALIQWGTTPNQRTVEGKLEEIPRKAEQQGISAPAVLVVGEVVGMRPMLAWFERLPLFGKRVVVTRARKQASRLMHVIEQLGGMPIALPTISIEDPLDWGPVDRAIEGIRSYDWCIFTSTNGVERFLGRLFERGHDSRWLAGVGLAAIGANTGKALSGYGLRADVVPDVYTSEGLLEAFYDVDVGGRSFLIPRASEARDVLPKALRERGANVTVVEAYRNRMPPHEEVDMGLNELASGLADAIVFTSSSTVRNFLKLTEGRISRDSLSQVPLFCIGPVTASTAAELLGGENLHVSKMATIDSLVDKMVEHFSGSQGVRPKG